MAITSSSFSRNDSDRLSASRFRKSWLASERRFWGVRRFTTLAILGLLLFVAPTAQAIDPTPPPPPPNIAPIIDDFIGTQGVLNWTFSGQVLDEHPVGMVITFGSLLSGHQTTVSNANGYFSYTVTVSGSGVVTAHTVDDHQQGSNTANYNVQ